MSGVVMVPGSPCGVAGEAGSEVVTSVPNDLRTSKSIVAEPISLTVKLRPQEGQDGESKERSSNS
jgi:hypothetical protein